MSQVDDKKQEENVIAYYGFSNEFIATLEKSMPQKYHSFSVIKNNYHYDAEKNNIGVDDVIELHDLRDISKLRRWQEEKTGIHNDIVELVSRTYFIYSEFLNKGRWIIECRKKQYPFDSTYYTAAIDVHFDHFEKNSKSIHYRIYDPAYVALDAYLYLLRKNKHPKVGNLPSLVSFLINLSDKAPLGKERYYQSGWFHPANIEYTTIQENVKAQYTKVNPWYKELDIRHGLPLKAYDIEFLLE